MTRLPSRRGVCCFTDRGSGDGGFLICVGVAMPDAPTGKGGRSVMRKVGRRLGPYFTARGRGLRPKKTSSLAPLL